MSAIDQVRALNSLFERQNFTSLRDALEASEPDAISSGLAEADALVRESIAERVVVEFHGATALPEGRRYVGLDAYLKLWRQWLAAFDEYELEHSGYEQVGANVLVAVVHRGRGRGAACRSNSRVPALGGPGRSRARDPHLRAPRPGAGRPGPGQ
jgi:hypothetical protein